MSKDHVIKVAIHFSIYAARGDSNWPFIFQSLARLLSRYACAEKSIRKNVLLFTFFHSPSAFTAVLECLNEVKNKYVDRDYRQALPFKIIFHLDDPEGKELPLDDANNDLWDFLQFGHLYVNKHLKEYLDQNILWKELPEHTVKSTENLKLFDVLFSTPSTITTPPLFANRNLPVQGKGEICYYCGMRQHKTAACPSRLLTMHTQGLLDAGEITFEKLNEAYGETFSHFSQLAGSISPQLDPAKTKTNLPLMALLAFFDVSRVFQLRFFYSMFVSSASAWPQLGETHQKSSQNSTLQLGYDNLLAGNYVEAQQKFDSEASKALGELFYAHIGLAFIALEQGKDMANYLGNAISLATSAEEKIYAYLLLSRHFESTGENQKADAMINFIHKLNFYCADADYRSVQINAKNGITQDQAKKFRGLLAHREFFMAALIDPALQPIRGITDSLLLHVFQQNIHTAKINYFKARTAYTELMQLVDDREKIHDTIEKRLSELEQLLNEKQYLKIVNAAKKAKDTSSLCINLTEKITNEVKQKTKNCGQRLARLKKFWLSYPFKSYFKKFNEELIEHKEKYDAICGALEKESKKNLFKENKTLLYKLDSALQEMEAKKQKMSDLKNGMEYFSTFCKNLLFAEGLMAFGGTALLMLIVAVTTKEPWSNLFGALQTLPNSRGIIIFLLAFAAPLLALIMTVRSFLLKKKKRGKLR